MKAPWISRPISPIRSTPVRRAVHGRWRRSDGRAPLSPAPGQGQNARRTLDPLGSPNLYEIAGIGRGMASCILDIRDADGLRAHLKEILPESIFHLAAQPLVRSSYQDAVGTFATNVLGTANLLDAVRSCPSVRAVVIITTDKVYQNREWAHPYRESDALGGHDPYSASKAAAEIITASMRASFFIDTSVRIATARAGNVIGGGDWATDRLVPDCLRAFSENVPVRLRFPDAVRPWQHVLDPLAGYLALAAHLLSDTGSEYMKAWNFGPNPPDTVRVGDVADRLASLWGDSAKVIREIGGNHPHEAGLLTLDSSAARYDLGWKPRWALETALQHTVDWHRAWLRGDNMYDYSLRQIEAYQSSFTL